MLAGDEISRNCFVLVCVGQACGVYAGVARLALDEVGTTVPACEAFADDLGCEAEVCRAFRAPQMRCVAIEELAFRRQHGSCGRVGRSRGCNEGIGGRGGRGQI